MQHKEEKDLFTEQNKQIENHILNEKKNHKDYSEDHTGRLKMQMKDNFNMVEQDRVNKKIQEKESTGLKLESYQRNPRLEAMQRDQKAVLAHQYRSGRVEQFSPDKSNERYMNDQFQNKLIEVPYYSLFY